MTITGKNDEGTQIAEFESATNDEDNVMKPINLDRILHKDEPDGKNLEAALFDYFRKAGHPIDLILPVKGISGSRIISPDKFIGKKGLDDY